MMNIQTDTRKIKPGDTFVALRGISRDGHSFIEKAIENGATKIIAEEGMYSVETIIVEDTRKYLNQYLKENYGSYVAKMNMIAVTGTNGKTTVAMLIHDALNKAGSKAAYIGTVGFYIQEKISNLVNTTVDICDTYGLLMEAYQQGCKNIVMEVSSEGAANGRIESLDFDYAIFTNLTHDHLYFHKTMENYALAKQTVFQALKNTGTAFVNADDEYQQYFLLEKNKNVTYGFEQADFQVIEYSMTSEKTTFDYRYNQEIHQIETKLLGKYNVYNILSVIAFLTVYGFENEIIHELISQLNAPVGRMEIVNYKTNNIVIDYAHTADAIQKIMSTLKEITKGNTYTVFGCTGDRDRIKRPIMANIVSENSDYFIITNDDPHYEDEQQIVDDMIENSQFKNYEIELNREKAIIKGIELLKENDVLLILGKGHEEEMIIKDTRIPFNDKKVVEKYLEKISQ